MKTHPLITNPKLREILASELRRVPAKRDALIKEIAYMQKCQNEEYAERINKKAHQPPRPAATGAGNRTGD